MSYIPSTAPAMQITNVPPTPTTVPEIIRRMETIADDLKRSGVMNLGLSLAKQIDELKEILGVRE